MSPSQVASINQFMRSVAVLREQGIVRSHRYLGDLGEFLCADAFGIDLATNLRQVGHDGLRDQLRAQIKYHGGKSTTVDLGDPAHYDEVYVVLGPDSMIRPDGYAEEFLIYQLSASQVREFASEAVNYYCTERRLPQAPTRRIGLSEFTP
jgi:hypothetical protein